jgi:hypothetical protein
MMLSENLKTWEGMDIEVIEFAYKEISPLIQYDIIDSKTRTKLKKLMEAFLPDYDIKCDEENNPPEVVDSQHIIMRVSKPAFPDGTTKYIDVIF